MNNPTAPHPDPGTASAEEPRGGALDVLAVFAHPDDAELLCGGALAKSVDRGERVGILDLTRGEMGSRGTAEQREEEARRAAELLGVHLRRNAGFPDAGLVRSAEFRDRIAAYFRELRPRVVVTHWLEGRHPDHEATARLVRDAAFHSALKKAGLPGEPFRPHKIVHAIAFREDVPAPSFVVDVSEQMDRKMAALACHRSQFEGAVAAGEVFPGGDRRLEEQIRAHLAASGSRIRVAYGEPFWTPETLSVETLGKAPVSSY